MTTSNKIYWIDINRFDKKPNKSVLLEMANALNNEGFEVEILTSYGDKKYQPNNGVVIRYIRALDYGFVFRYSLLLNIFMWIVLRGDRHAIYVMTPCGLLIAPLMWLFGTRNIHLDIRSFHVDIHTFKKKLDNFLFWIMPLRLFGWIPRGYSFITERLRTAVEIDVNLGCTDYVIWQSGVSSAHFNPELKKSELDDKFNLFYHGTVTKNRGVYRVIQAIGKLSKEYKDQLRFIVVGTGVGYDHLSVVAEQEGISHLLVLKGLVPYEQIPEEIAVADVCICPLPGLPEWDMSSPLKVMEYMAAARPVILTPIPAHQDILDKEGFVVWCDGDEIDDLSKSIQYSIEHREELSKAAQIGPEVVREHHEWSSQARKLSTYLKRKFK